MGRYAASLADFTAALRAAGTAGAGGIVPVANPVGKVLPIGKRGLVMVWLAGLLGVFIGFASALIWGGEINRRRGSVAAQGHRPKAGPARQPSEQSDLSHVLTGVLLAAASFAIIKLIAMVLA